MHLATRLLVCILLATAHAMVAAQSVMGASPQPRPAIARIIVPENGATSYGSGSLIDVRGEYGLVITNWHVVRDANDVVEVVFPNGFRSKARPLKVDADWDLAALIIWRPPIEPVTIAQKAPRPGDVLTICGYGQGEYREATGRCTQYLAPDVKLPREMVELSVEARHGDSGGPILNDRGELAGVLFGASQGTTLGSFAGRVDAFLASLAPDVGKNDAQVATADANPQLQINRFEHSPEVHVAEVASKENHSELLATNHSPVTFGNPNGLEPIAPKPIATASIEPIWAAKGNSEELSKTINSTNAPLLMPPGANAPTIPANDQAITASVEAPASASDSLHWQDFAGQDWFQQGKTILALVGLVFLMLQAVRLAA